MPRDGAMTFGDLIGQLEELVVTCPKCHRVGRYSVRRLALQHGRDTMVPDWIASISGDCVRGALPGITDDCAAPCPEAANMLQPLGASSGDPEEN
ncbi:MAG TPA: hypothetical protein VK281_11210 [Xanthobacteraceae bacterium]|nr:hypothetical protein [Xanthobacteraceae bacterium]